MTDLDDSPLFRETCEHLLFTPDLPEPQRSAMDWFAPTALSTPHTMRAVTPSPTARSAA